MSGIDRRLDKILGEQSREVGRDSLAPERTYADADSFHREGQTDEDPGTTNPDASELEYDPADEFRDVSSRLNGYQAEAFSEEASGYETIDLTLYETWRIAQRSSAEFLAAEEDYILAGIRLLQERHRWGPRLFNDTSAFVSGMGDDGNYDSAVRVLNDLRVTQRLPYGGAVSARWLWEATDQLRAESSEGYTQSSSIVLDGNIPLLRGAGNVAREDRIQAERNLVYAARSFERFRREFLVDISRDYFSLLQTLAQIENQNVQVESLKRVVAETDAKVEAGILPEFDRNNATNDLLQGQSSLEQLLERYRLQLARFRIRLGLPVRQPAEIKNLLFDPPEPNATLDGAVDASLRYRLDLQNRRDQLDDRRRGVDNAINDTLPDLDLTGDVTLPTDPDDDVGGVSFDPDSASYSVGVTFGLPLDREIERLTLREQVIRMEQASRDYADFRDGVVLDARGALRAIDLARFQLDLAERRVEITERRQEEQEIKRDEVTTQERLDTAARLLDAQNARDQARTDLRNAVLNYLLTTGQLRVQRDGTFEELPGMDLDARAELARERNEANEARLRAVEPAPEP